MTDEEIIEKAYATTVEKLYSVFFQAMVVSTSPEEDGQAGDRFAAGLKIARQTKTLAKQLLR